MAFIKPSIVRNGIRHSHRSSTLHFIKRTSRLFSSSPSPINRSPQDTLNQTLQGYEVTIRRQQIDEIMKKHEIVRKFTSDPENASAAGALAKKLNMLWTYNSLALEGNRLSFGDTIFYLENDLTVGGKTVNDFLEATGHAEAIQLVHDYVGDKRDISRHFLCEINQLLTGHVKEIDAITPTGSRVKVPFTAGRFRNTPTHVRTRDGSVHRYVEAFLIDGEMQTLIDYVNNSPDHAVVKAAVAHYNFVRIHPFQDGNGRGARVLMNFVLLKAGLLPTVVQVSEREKYLEALRVADQGDITPFVQFIASSTEKTLDMLIHTIEKELK